MGDGEVVGIICAALGNGYDVIDARRARIRPHQGTVDQFAAQAADPVGPLTDAVPHAPSDPAACRFAISRACLSLASALGRPDW
jgi:hypothetical protein